jgi:hypothetical protein
MDIKIDFDTFPSTLFKVKGSRGTSNPIAAAMRNAVESAASTWSSNLVDIFPAIPANTTVSIGNPYDGGFLNSPLARVDTTVGQSVSGIVIFVASSYQFLPGNNASTSTQQEIVKTTPGFDFEYQKAGLEGINYQPFAGSIAAISNSKS